jgi:hypothetical protein
MINHNRDSLKSINQYELKVRFLDRRQYQGRQEKVEMKTLIYMINFTVVAMPLK